MFAVAKLGAVHVISGDQPLYQENVVEVQNLCRDVLAHRPVRLVMNLEHVPLIDSAGLELLLTLRDSCLHGGGFFHVAAPTPLCRDILTVSGVARQVGLFDSVTTAAGSQSR